MKYKEVKITLKGKALLLAIDTGLLRPSPILRRVRLDEFEAFWSKLEELLADEGYHRDNERGERNEEREDR